MNVLIVGRISLVLSLETFEATLSAIYDTALTHDAWPTALRRLCGLFDCHFADTFQRTNDYSAWRGTQVGLDETDYQDVFLGYWVKNNVWGQRRPTRHSGDVVTTRDIIGKRELQGSDMYSEYLRPRQLQEGLRLDVLADENGIEDISLLRPWSADAYDAEELNAARLLMPHLQRASALRRKLAAAVGLADAGLSSLEHLQMAALMLYRDGRVAYANRAACVILTDKDPVSAGPEGLCAATMASTRVLQRLVHEACAGHGRGPRSGSVRLPRASGRPDVLAVAMPIRPGVHDPFDLTRSAALLCLIDRDRHTTPTSTHLVELFGLTPAEAELASHMLEGRPMHEIASRTGRSVHTVRCLLGRLMAKTETNRQSELIQLLTKVPQE